MYHSILLHFQRIQHPLLVSSGISSVCSGHCIDANAHTSTLQLNKYFKSPLFFLYNTIHLNTLLDIIQMLSQLSVFLLSVLYDARLSHSLVSLTSHLFIDSVISYCRLQLPPLSGLGWAISLLSRPSEGSRASSLRGFSLLHTHFTGNFFPLKLLGEVWYC